MTGRTLILVALFAVAALAADAILAFAILEEWGDVGAIIINLVAYVSTLTLIAVGVAALRRRKRLDGGR